MPDPPEHVAAVALSSVRVERPDNGSRCLGKGATGICFSPKVGSLNDIWTVTLQSAFAGQNAVPAGKRSRMDLFLR